MAGDGREPQTGRIRERSAPLNAAINNHVQVLMVLGIISRTRCREEVTK